MEKEKIRGACIEVTRQLDCTGVELLDKRHRDEDVRPEAGGLAAREDSPTECHVRTTAYPGWR